jgi:spore germination protein
LKPFEYSDQEIGQKEVFYLVANMVIGFGVLTLPRSIVEYTKSIDGWISICIGGIIALFFTWIVAKLTMRFPKKNFYEISSAILNKYVASILTFLFATYSILFVSYEMRGVASISQLYLFDTTPVEVICLVFLLVIIYGISGQSIVILRINLMFLPIVLFIVFVLMVMNLGHFEFTNLKPFFISNWKDIGIASKETVFSFLGFEFLLFYNSFINQPKCIRKSALKGISIPLILYLTVFIFVIGVFGVDVTKNTLYPTAELAKQVEVPGGFFERFESIFFTIWVMTLFSTAAMAFDVTLLALGSIMKKVQRIHFIFILSPIVYLIAMSPQNLLEVTSFGNVISYTGIVFSMAIPAVLLIIALIRGVKGDV